MNFIKDRIGMTCQARNSFKVAVFLFLAAVCAVNAAENAYWRDAQELRKGVKFKELKMSRPRKMNAWVMRIDLKTPGIGFVSTERAARWGERMPDYTNGVRIIRTKREKTASFMKRKRAEGKNVMVAVNTAPWGPWCPPWNHAYADPGRWVVSGGIEVCAGKTPGKGALFVVRKDGRAKITSYVPPAERKEVAHVHPGFAIIATNGIAIAGSDLKSLHPRTAFGVSGGGRYLYLLAVDGRQPGYSLGANMKDLCDIMLEAGASDVMNMDGGGSTSLVVYDKTAKAPRMLNRHHGGAMRTVALNFGITFD